jgi:hypothetical protein
MAKRDKVGKGREKVERRGGCCIEQSVARGGASSRKLPASYLPATTSFTGAYTPLKLKLFGPTALCARIHRHQLLPRQDSGSSTTKACQAVPRAYEHMYCSLISEPLVFVGENREAAADISSLHTQFTNKHLQHCSRPELSHTPSLPRTRELHLLPRPRLCGLGEFLRLSLSFVWAQTWSECLEGLL